MPSVNKPRLKTLDELFMLHGGDGPLDNQENGLPRLASVNADYEVIQFVLMDDYPGHPFKLYEGERESDMIESIRANGILQPLILRAMDNGRYQILSGHNRKQTGIKAGLADAPAVIKRGLTDDEARVYVIETNLMQRSFADMPHSEKAAVIAMQHSKLFSQGKRSDTIEELRMLENPHEYRADGTCTQLGYKSKSREAVAENYSLANRQLEIPNILYAKTKRRNKAK